LAVLDYAVIYLKIMN